MLDNACIYLTPPPQGQFLSRIARLHKPSVPYYLLIAGGGQKKKTKKNED